jgi:hypothetical protein
MMQQLQLQDNIQVTDVSDKTHTKELLILAYTQQSICI